MGTTAKFQAAKEKMREAQREAAKVAQEAFKEGASEVFESYPRLESFGWRQYTPYFNDGDECVFSAHTDDLTINGQESYKIDALRETITRPTGETETVPSWRPGTTETRQKYERVPNPGYDAALKVSADAATAFLAGFDTGDFRDLFGDHIRVTVYRDGRLETEEYEHD